MTIQSKENTQKTETTFTINPAQLVNERFNTPIGKVPRSKTKTSFKAKILAEADRQLAALDAMQNDSELNYESKGNSGRFWWLSNTTDNKRYVRPYVQNRLVVATDDAVIADNTVAAVREAVVNLRAIVSDTPAAHWEIIKQQRDANAKKRKSHAQS